MKLNGLRDACAPLTYPVNLLQVTAVLETREVLNAAAVHPSRKNSSTITKV